MIDFHQTSIAVIRAGQAPSGAYVASPTFSQYGYSWLRDGAWISYAMNCAGQHDSARAFHQWVGKTLLYHRHQLDVLLAKLERGETPAECDYLPTRFTTSGELGTEAWGDFQLDGYGAWLWGVAMHARQVDADVWKSLRPAVEMTVRYLGALWQSPNYDCWEENRQHVHTATLAAVYGGLRAVQNLDAALVPTGLPEKIRAFALRECVAQDGHFVKFIGDEAVDASLLWVALPYGLVDLHDEPFAKTLAKIERDLHYPGGGVYRYQADVYFGGGEWLLLTAWLAWVYVKLNRIDDARPLMRWIEAQAMPTGEFPEQVADHLLHPGHYDEWVQKWGTSACPLLWSHAMYLILEAALKDRG